MFPSRHGHQPVNGGHVGGSVLVWRGQGVTVAGACNVGIVFSPALSAFSGGAHGKKGDQASRLISTGPLQPLRALHIRPIDPVVFRES